MKQTSLGSGRRKAVLSTFVGNTANTLIITIQGVFLIPLYIKAIGPSLYGAWLGSGDILIWLQAIDLGLPLMIQRIGTSHGKGDTRKVSEFFWAGTIVLTMVSLIIVLLSLALSSVLPSLMDIHGQDAFVLQKCFLLGSLATAIRMIANTAYGLALGIQETSLMNATKVASAIVGLGVSLGIILMGGGLWSIAFGLLARAVFFFLGGIVFVSRCFMKKTLIFSRITSHVIREFATVSPTIALGNLGYALMNQSESAITAIFISPDMATILNITRKAVDVASGIADSIAYSSFGSFAHLIASPERNRSIKVHAEIISLRLSVAIAFGSAYMAVNESLVTLWVGRAYYGGAMLTILFALRSIVAGNSYLLNYLYRASGGIVRGSIALLAESVIRFPLMIVFLLWLGISGLPIAGLITSGIFGLLAYRWTMSILSEFSLSSKTVYFRTWMARLSFFAIGLLMCLYTRWDTWIEVLTLGSILAILSGATFLLIDPLLINTRLTISALLRRHFNEISGKH